MIHLKCIFIFQGIDFAEQKVSFTCNKKEFIALGILGKSIDDVNFVEILIKENVPIAIIENISSVKKRI